MTVSSWSNEKLLAVHVLVTIRLFGLGCGVRHDNSPACYSPVPLVRLCHGVCAAKSWTISPARIAAKWT
jgi:hypothetical protein